MKTFVPDSMTAKPQARQQGASHPERDALRVQRSLVERPVISIRMRIICCFILLSILLCVSTLTALIFLSRFDAKVQFVDKLTRYAFEIQQARRFEMNFFLYGTNLQDALENIQVASGHLSRSSADVKRVAGDRAFRRMEESLAEYRKRLEELLLSSGGRSRPEPGPGFQKTEMELRRFGADAITAAEDLIENERVALSEMLHSSIFILFLFLTVTFLAMALVSFLLTRAVLAPLRRFEHYTDRIASGDYSLIVPKRRYRDEFSQFALALNHMLQELELRQQQLIQSAKMAAVGSLTSGIAHELNNPLNNIGIVTESLIDGYHEHTDEQKMHMLDQISTQVERASSTVRNLLDFTRKDKPVFTTVSMPDVIRDTAKLLGNEMKFAGIELKINIEPGIPSVSGSPLNIQQVLLNLMLNSIQAMPEGGTLTVSVSVEQDFLRIDVGDTGIGIPDEDLAKVFDPFFTTKEPGVGTGLGLTVSYSIIEAHSGKITVESGIGKGTVFSVYLPLKAGERDTPARQKKA